MFILHIYSYKGTEVFMVHGMHFITEYFGYKKLNTENFAGNLDIW